MGKGDRVAQADFIFRRIGEILEAAGGSFDDVVKTLVNPEALIEIDAIAILDKVVSDR